MKYPVIVTETFSKLIIVEANNEEEALDKCWDTATDVSTLWTKDNNSVYFDYLVDESEINFEIGTEEDKTMITEHENFYDYLE